MNRTGFENWPEVTAYAPVSYAPRPVALGYAAGIASVSVALFVLVSAFSAVFAPVISSLH